MEEVKVSHIKSKGLRMYGNGSKKPKAFEKGFKKLEFKVGSKIKFQGKKGRDYVMRIPKEDLISESGIEHLEYLTGKNEQARKRLLELQKRLMEFNTKDNLYHADEIKLPQALEIYKPSDTISIIQKYTVIPKSSQMYSSLCK